MSTNSDSKADDSEIDSILAKEASELARDTEIERILNAFPLDAYSVLNLQPGVSPSDIKNTFRKKSLLIHPDKTSNPRAPDAFDRLKKAERALQDEKTRTMLDTAFTDARRLLIRERRWTIHDERLKSEEFLNDWRQKTQEVLVEMELRKRRLQRAQLEEEGRQKRKAEQDQEERIKKREMEKAWEDTRDTRVTQWREFRKQRDAASAAAAASHSKSSTTALNAHNAAAKLSSSISNGSGSGTSRPGSMNGGSREGGGSIKKKRKIKKGQLEVLG